MNTTKEIKSVLTDSQLSNFFAHQLQCLYLSETKLLEAIAEIQQAASTGEVKALIGQYREKLKTQVTLLEEIFRVLMINPGSVYGDTMDCLIKEIGQIIINTSRKSITRNAALIVALQKAGHYKIACYGSLAQLATTLGMEDIANILHQSLQSEKDSDYEFSDFAEKRLNWLAETE